MSSKAIIRLVAVLILAGGWSSCKDDPITPKPPPVVDKRDTVHHVLSIVPDSSSRVIIHATTVLKLSALPALPKPFTIIWTIDSQTTSRLSVDTLPVKFDGGLRHAVKAVYVDSTGSRRDSTYSVLNIRDTTVLPGDTSSHEFVWKEFTNVDGERNMTGCWVFGPNDIWTINGDLHHFDGSSWSTIVVHDENGKSLQGAMSGCSIFGFSPTDMWFTNAGESLHYTGNGKVVGYKTWQIAPSWTYSAWGTSSSDLYVVGDSGTILHFNGSKWTKMTTPTKKNLYSVTGTSNSNLWSAGYNTETGESELLHYNGSAWTKDSLSATGLTEQWGLTAVHACDSLGHPTVAVSGWTMFRKTENGSWRSDSGKIPNDVGGRIWMAHLCGNSSNDLLVMGDEGFIAHWNGNSWKRYDQFLQDGTIPRQGAMKGKTACVVGYKNGSSWVLIGQRQ